MANAVIGALRVVLGMDAGEFRKGGKEAETVLGRLERAAAVSSRSIVGDMATIGTAIAAAFAPAVLAKTVKHFIDLADETYKLSQRIGISVEALSKLEYAAGLADVSQEELRKGLEKLVDTFDKAKDKTSETARMYAALGISATGLAAERLQVHVDAGQRRPSGERHHLPIVEADDRHVVRD